MADESVLCSGNAYSVRRGGSRIASKSPASSGFGQGFAPRFRSSSRPFPHVAVSAGIDRSEFELLDLLDRPGPGAALLVVRIDYQRGVRRCVDQLVALHGRSRHGNESRDRMGIPGPTARSSGLHGAPCAPPPFRDRRPGCPRRCRPLPARRASRPDRSLGHRRRSRRAAPTAVSCPTFSVYSTSVSSTFREPTTARPPSSRSAASPHP